MGNTFIFGDGPNILKVVRPCVVEWVCALCGQPIAGPIERRPSDNALIHPAGQCPIPSKEVS